MSRAVLGDADAAGALRCRDKRLNAFAMHARAIYAGAIMVAPSLAASLAVVSPRSAGAQVMAAARSLTPTAVADSLKVLDSLDREVRSAGTAASWYRRALVGWALGVRAAAPDPPRGLDQTRLGRLADTSLRIAVRLDPTNAQYRLTMGRFLIASGVAITRTAAGGFFQNALRIARDSGPTRLHAEAAIEVGLVAWRRYEALANRRMATSPADVGRSLSEAMQPVAKGAHILEEIAERERADDAVRSLLQRGGVPTRAVAAASADANARAAERTQAGASIQSALPTTMTDGRDGHGLALMSSSLKSVRDLIETNTLPLPSNVTGAGDFARADSLFAEAYAADPSLAPTFRLTAMIRAEGAKWDTLAAFARAHIARFPDDGFAWMTLGLASQRQMRTAAAMAAFDTGLVRLGAPERSRLDDIARVLGPARARSMSLTDDARAALARMYWVTADPLWSTGGNDSRAEILARVTFAELRWTVEEAGIKGADTDRGDVFVRYGPPDVTAVIGPNVSEYAADIMTFWMYRSGLMFAFSSIAGFGTARIPAADEAMVAGMKDAQPVRFDNVAALRPDSMIAQVARFRGTAQRIDVLIAAAPPVSRIRESMTFDAPIRVDAILVAGTAQVVYRDSVWVDSSGVRAWRVQLRPAEYLLRVEASAPTAARAARASQLLRFGDFPFAGPGISDVLVAASASVRAAPASRWSDFSIVPAVGTVPVGSEVALVWEAYDFSADMGTARYDVAVTLRRTRSSGAAIAARIVGALAGLARAESAPDQFTVHFQRATPHAAILPDLVSIDLGDTPPGSYTIEVTITDLATAKAHTRNSTLTIVAPPR